MSTSIVFDIETGGLPEAELRALYKEKTAEEFAAECDKRWKPETIAAKYEEYKISGWAEFQDRAALSAITGQVVAIGLRSCKGVKILAGDETEVIKAFWTLYGKATTDKRRMIGHSIFGFDLKFLIRRSHILNVAIPDGVRKGRYFSDVFIDTMVEWGCGDSQDRISLDNLSRVLGGSGKPEGDDACTGAIFAKLFLSGSAEDRAKAEQYLQSDLENTWIVAERMNLL
jgi:hypothetical protein